MDSLKSSKSLGMKIPRRSENFSGSRTSKRGSWKRSASVVYGLAMPSSTRTFAGLNTLPIQYIRRDVQGKLGGVFREEHFKTAITYLRRNGVLIEPKSGTRGSEAYSLNINERAKGVTAEGREIIAAVKRFLHEHLPTRRK